MPNKEPVITAATISGLISAALVMLVALEVISLDDNQMVAITSFVALAAPIAIAFWPRSQVTTTADPKIKTPTGKIVPLVREDGGPLPQ